jgi:hypothetical protein
MEALDLEWVEVYKAFREGITLFVGWGGREVGGSGS